MRVTLEQAQPEIPAQRELSEIQGRKATLDRLVIQGQVRRVILGPLGAQATRARKGIREQVLPAILVLLAQSVIREPREPWVILGHKAIPGQARLEILA